MSATVPLLKPAIARPRAVPTAPARSRPRLVIVAPARSTAGRLPFVAGLDRYLPAAFGRVHPRWGSPYVALLVQAVIAAVFIVTVLTPKRYTTDVKMIAGNPNSVASNPQQAQTGLPFLNALLLANAAQSAETYAELIGETPVVQHVIDDLGLKTVAEGVETIEQQKFLTHRSVTHFNAVWKARLLVGDVPLDSTMRKLLVAQAIQMSKGLGRKAGNTKCHD